MKFIIVVTTPTLSMKGRIFSVYPFSKEWEGMKKTALAILKALAFGIGAVFPFTAVLWKTIILIVFFILRVIDEESDRKLMSVASCFFIGMIIGYTYKLLQP